MLRIIGKSQKAWLFMLLYDLKWFTSATNATRWPKYGLDALRLSPWLYSVLHFLASYESNQANLRDGTRNQTGRAVGVKNSCALSPHQLHDIDWVLVGVQNPLGLSKQHKSPSPRMHCPASSTLAVWQTPFCPQVLMAPRCVSLWQQRHLQQQQQPEGEERRLAYITLPSITI